MGNVPLPTPQQVRELLELLLGKEVDVSTGADMPSPNAPGGLVVGEFVVDPGSRLAGLWVCDLAAGAAIGAALGLMPPSAVTAALAEGMPTVMLDNLHEVVNVAGSLLNGDGRPHVLLREVYPPGSRLPVSVASMVSAYVPRQNLAVTVAGYAGGTVSIVVP